MDIRKDYQVHNGTLTILAGVWGWKVFFPYDSCVGRQEQAPIEVNFERATQAAREQYPDFESVAVKMVERKKDRKAEQSPAFAAPYGMPQGPIPSQLQKELVERHTGREFSLALDEIGIPKEILEMMPEGWVTEKLVNLPPVAVAYLARRDAELEEHLSVGVLEETVRLLSKQVVELREENVRLHYRLAARTVLEPKVVEATLQDPDADPADHVKNATVDFIEKYHDNPKPQAPLTEEQASQLEDWEELQNYTPSLSTVWERLQDLLWEGGYVGSSLKIKSRSDIPADKPFREALNLDSLDLVEFWLEVEEEFGIEIPDEDSERLGTLAQCVDYLVVRLREQELF